MEPKLQGAKIRHIDPNLTEHLCIHRKNNRRWHSWQIKCWLCVWSHAQSSIWHERRIFSISHSYLGQLPWFVLQTHCITYVCVFSFLVFGKSAHALVLVNLFSFSFFLSGIYFFLDILPGQTEPHRVSIMDLQSWTHKSQLIIKMLL